MPITEQTVKEILHDVVFFYSLFGMVPKNMETEEEKLEQFGKWTKEFKAENRRFAGKVLRPYSSFGRQLHELVKSYLIPCLVPIPGSLISFPPPS